jgi:hypothetical protein
MRADISRAGRDNIFAFNLSEIMWETRAEIGDIMEIVLTLEHVTNSLTELEQQYGFSTEDFLQDQSLQLKVSPDDFFTWQALADHKKNLVDQEIDRSYLTRISGESTCAKDRGDIQHILAA